MAHGRYCQSGVAQKKSKDGFDVAECVTFDQIRTIKDNAAGPALPSPYACSADGKTYCEYLKNKKVAFKLLCECALTNTDGSNAGYCPIPDATFLEYNIRMLKTVWEGDNCHTFDRDNFAA